MSELWRSRPAAAWDGDDVAAIFLVQADGLFSRDPAKADEHEAFGRAIHGIAAISSSLRSGGV